MIDYWNSSGFATTVDVDSKGLQLWDFCCPELEKPTHTSSTQVQCPSELLGNRFYPEQINISYVSRCSKFPTSTPHTPMAYDVNRLHI